jgi:hypothetical protein
MIVLVNFININILKLIKFSVEHIVNIIVIYKNVKILIVMNFFLNGIKKNSIKIMKMKHAKNVKHYEKILITNY